MSDDILWQTKLHARLHDPAEKALVLLRDPAGHEGGTSAALHRDLGFHELPTEGRLDPDSPEALHSALFKDGIPAGIYRHVKRADGWAAGADRPQWPMEEITVKTKTFKVADWAQVRWAKQPVLIHPLTGREFDLKSLAATDIADIKQRSLQHFSRLTRRDGAAVDWRKTLLAYWRFGPELAEAEDNGKLGALWPLLPADTRVPDHSIWDHLDLTSAFAGAFAADPDGEAALLALSLGPIQGFIAAARTTSDLWAGSHLLSRLSWEAMKVVCERLGPDAILFPRLRGIPQVDLWLRDEMGLPGEWFNQFDWANTSTDANPLFAAALPNRFVAAVPRSQAKAIAEAVESHVRDWLQKQGEDVVDRLLDVAQLRQPGTRTTHAYAQMKAQLEGFPEVHWAAVPFSLIRPRDANRQTDLDTGLLSEAMAPFFGAEAGKPCGFLDTTAWRVLQKETEKLGNIAFFTPKPGALYPAVYDLAERVLAAAKALRPFAQTKQTGWRCSLTGETEWLTTDPGQLATSYRQQTETLWAKVAKQKPAWAKKGEHLGALPAIKRLWPNVFAEEVAKATGQDKQDKKAAERFVVSTHTMALVKNLETLHGRLSEREAQDSIKPFVTDKDQAPALPRSLARMRGTLAARIPAVLDRLSESEEPEAQKQQQNLERTLKNLLGHKLETYYALILMDGDHMGRILSGEDEGCAISYRESFHPAVREGFDRLTAKHPLLKAYGAQKRAVSPHRHLAVSAALNDFALHVVPHVIEREHLGRVLYAGGDDVLAMLPVADLLSAMRRLRHTYSGTAPAAEPTDWRTVRGSKGLVCQDGFAHLDGRLMRMMGDKATASCGAVVAHHQAPLAAVLRELRSAEHRAKNEGGRDAFSLTVIKRSGGALHLTGKWGAMELLRGFRDFLAEPEVSRRAVYNSLIWLKDLPKEAEPKMLAGLLAYQLARQSGGKTVRDFHDLPGLARRLADLACEQKDRHDWLKHFLTVAEFLARETRSGQYVDGNLKQAGKL